MGPGCFALKGCKELPIFDLGSSIEESAIENVLGIVTRGGTIDRVWGGVGRLIGWENDVVYPRSVGAVFVGAVFGIGPYEGS